MPSQEETRELAAPAPDLVATPGETGSGWTHRMPWNLSILLVAFFYFLILSGTLLYKQRQLLFDWPFDDAYMIQQFHNWNSGYATVTIQPGDLRSGLPGEKPFEENHKKWIYTVFKPFYWLWPYPETLILLYAFFVSLSVVTLYLLLKQLGLDPPKTFALVACWMLYPLQQKVAVYSFCDPLSMSGTFYFFYLYLLCRNSPFAVLGCLALLLPREQTPLLILPTFLLLPKKWKTLLWHLACLLPFLIFARSKTGDPFAYAAYLFQRFFITNFLLTQTVLWVLVLVNPRALLIAGALMLVMIGVGGEIFFKFPYEFLGPDFLPPASFYYYGLFVAPMMAAVAIGIARLKPARSWRLYLSLALLLVPGIAYSICQLRFLCPIMPEARQVEAFRAAEVTASSVVVTDYRLSAAFANRDQIYVYQQPPPGITPEEMFSRADVAAVLNLHTNEFESLLIEPPGQNWQRILETDHYTFYRNGRAKISDR
jgi:uncharacterized membrane protein